MNRTKISLLIVSILLVLGLAGCATSGEQVKGYVTGVSVANRTVTVNSQLIHVPRNIPMTKSGNPIALQDIAIGNRIHVRTEKASDGSVQAIAILLLVENNERK